MHFKFVSSDHIHARTIKLEDFDDILKEKMKRNQRTLKRKNSPSMW